MIRIENLTKKYGSFQALKGISLEVREGELFAFLGPNGSGKTTTINILTGLCAPSSGRVWLNGHDIASDTLNAKRQNGVVNQAINLDGELTVRENLLIHGMLFGMPRKQISARTEELLDYAEMADRADDPVKDLSGGFKRRLMIMRALMHKPRILFLDEPTVGLDPSIRRKIWSLIRKIQQGGTTIFLTTHYIEEAEFLAERVAFLNEGEIMAVDAPQALMAGLGDWALDELVEGEIRTKYFKAKGDANSAASSEPGAFTVRRVNLEDVFIKMTGKKVGEEPQP
ncbi:MAG: ABC transporter ATP-binding protein [Nitrospinae bacterium]|nr:ABC transporter ATP-binding protein [Nitrospinota bacterium]